MIILFCYNDNLISSCSSYVAEMFCLARCTGEIISNGNRTEWSPITSDNKIGWPRRGSLICLSRVWLQTELDDTKSYCQLIIKITISEKRKIAKLCYKGKFYIKKLTKVHKFRSLYTVSIVIETKVVIGWFKLTTLNVIGWFKLQLWIWLVCWTFQ